MSAVLRPSRVSRGGEPAACLSCLLERARIPWLTAPPSDHSERWPLSCQVTDTGSPIPPPPETSLQPHWSRPDNPGSSPISATGSTSHRNSCCPATPESQVWESRTWASRVGLPCLPRGAGAGASVGSLAHTARERVRTRWCWQQKVKHPFLSSHAHPRVLIRTGPLIQGGGWEPSQRTPL